MYILYYIAFIKSIIIIINVEYYCYYSCNIKVNYIFGGFGAIIFLLSTTFPFLKASGIL